MRIMNSFISILLGVFVCASVSQAQSACRTPVREAGKCVPITECSLHMDILKNSPKPLPADRRKYIMDSYCDVRNNVYIVCCAARHRISNGGTTTSVIMDPDDGSTDYSRHPSARLLSESNCGKIPDDRIAFGNDTALAEFPWVVQLQYDTSQGLEARCGGTLISKRYVLTAAHCVTRIRDPVVSVRLGEHDTSKDPDCDEIECMPPVQDIPIEEIKFHPQFNQPRFSNDIAVLRLRYDADLTRDSIRPICLPITKALQNAPLNRVVIAGWGLTEEKKAAVIMQKATIAIVPNEDCQMLYKRTTQITGAQICAGGEKGVDSCKGDSGGPLFFTGSVKGIRYVQYGVVSAGIGDCGDIETIPGVYARVSFYMKWILDQMRP